MLNGDGCGLGALRVAMALERVSPWGYGVSSVQEGDVLRRGGITRPVVVFTPILQTEIDALRRAQLTPALGDPAVIESWIRTGHPWHLQIDTGMCQSGMPWEQVKEHRALFERAMPNGVCTHFHTRLDDESRARQAARFAEALATLPSVPAVVHVENRTVAASPGPVQWTLFRPGIALYGVPESDRDPQTEPVVSVKARIVELRTVANGETVGQDATWTARGTRRIATVPVGYGDGYRRALSNRGVALLRGTRVPVAGRITMDMTMLDVTETTANLGDVVTLLGADGGDVITVAGMSAASDVSSYEILTGLRTRLPRQYRAVTEDGE
jgi:alanine racemase